MFAKDADRLKPGDKVFTFNGPYRQDARVEKVTKDHRGIRWIDYSWINPKGEQMGYSKRHMSVYLPENGE